MHVVVSIRQPSDVLFYRSLVAELEEGGHHVSVLTLDDRLAKEMLRTYGITYTTLEAEGTRSEHDQHDWSTQLQSHLGGLGADRFTGIDCPSVAEIDPSVASRCVLFRGSESAAGEAIDRQDTGDEVTALEYVVPNRFEPTADRLEPHGIEPEDPYFVVGGGTGRQSEGREHDRSVPRAVVAYLSEFGDVYVASSDRIRPLDGRDRQIPDRRRHDVLAFADLYVGDSPRLLRETGLLGTPSLWTGSRPTPDTWTLSTLESYGLVECSDGSVVQRVEQLVPNPARSAVWEQRRRRFLHEQYDETAYALDALVGLPPSRWIEPDRSSAAAGSRRIG